MRWVVADSLYCNEAFFCSHLDSYSHYLREAGEEVYRTRAPLIPSRAEAIYMPGASGAPWPDVLFALDGYEFLTVLPVKARIAQVAAVCNPMPWNVRQADGSPAYDLVISSIPWMVDEARAHGCRAEYQPLAFDTRARVCGMGVERDLGAIFVGTVGPNHVKRARVLAELGDLVTVFPPTFGRDYFRLLARAKVVVNVHAEWSRGVRNNMRLFEASGMDAWCVTDGEVPVDADEVGFFPGGKGVVDDRWRAAVIEGLDHRWAHSEDLCLTLENHTYESRIPQLIRWAKELTDTKET